MKEQGLSSCFIVMKSSLHAFQWPHGFSNLSLFFLKVRDEEGKLNSIQVQRLKDKLGTRQMATAELWLDGAKAELVCEVSPTSWDWAGLAWQTTHGCFGGDTS